MEDDLIALALKFVELAPLLPKWLVTAVRIIVELSVACSAVAALAKKLGLGQPNPATDTKWKQRLYKALHVVDKVALNSTPIQQMDKHRDELEQTRAASMPPGPRTSIPPGVGMTLLALAFALASCAATPLETHARAALTAADLIGAAGDAIETRLRKLEKDAYDASEYREDAEERLKRLRETYAPLELAYEMVRQAHAAYVDAIRRADAAGLEQPDPNYQKALAAAWAELAQRARMLGLLLPQPPPALRRLLPDPEAQPGSTLVRPGTRTITMHHGHDRPSLPPGASYALCCSSASSPCGGICYRGAP